MTPSDIINKYCALTSLKNESDVEQFFLLPLLIDLGYGPDYLDTKSTVAQVNIGKGKQKKLYYPDYLAYVTRAKGKPVLVIDAKHPNDSAEEGVQDAQLYTSVIRRKMNTPKPEQYCIGVNGNQLIVKHFDNDAVLIELSFEEFQDSNAHFIELKSKLGKEALRLTVVKQLSLGNDPWNPLKPTVEEIKGIFQKCHKRIWKRESLMPTAAFYEFTKLIFLKLREDERLHCITTQGKQITKKDLHFHVEWIDNNSEVSPNPVNSILFRNLADDLEEQVRKNKKKPIFTPNEQINLKPSTIRSVVELLQDYDLAGIDEDLNGRMFEVFLSAAVRGKNLGAFFTPRNIIELMVGMTCPSISKEGNEIRLETILDGCCGSGGFLIDVMASMLDQIHKNPALSAYSSDLEVRLTSQTIYGIDSNPDIARIARMNMFLHGDGGSRIYRADTLDKELQVEAGEAHTVQDEVNELKDLLLKQGKQFDIVLTNPPFASSYTSKDEHERRILSQYADLLYSKTKKKKKSSAKSNVLFLARYYELLRPSGRMSIIVDNSLLNSYNFSEYREWLKKNFIIRAIISLPKYSFIQAGAGGVTSVLYLDKRSDDKQQQPPIFARAVKYTGISKSGKQIKENDLPDVLKEWYQFEKTGKLYLRGLDTISERDSDDLFLIYPNELSDRIDVTFHSPSYRKLIAQIDEMAKIGTHEVRHISDFVLADKIDVEEAGDEIFQYVDIGTLDAERCQIMMGEVQEGTVAELADRARILLKENDVIFPLSYDSFGKVAIVPKELDGQLASTGFVSIRNTNYNDATLLWSIIRSSVMQKQFHHIASGYTQRGISKEHLHELRFPIPVKDRTVITESVKRFLADANKSRNAELVALKSMTSLVDNVLNQTSQ